MRRRLDPFLGHWIDGSGRRMTIEAGGPGALVSIVDPGGAPYERALLEGPGPTTAMPAALDEHGMLIVEVGTPGAGPTYALTPRDGGLVPSVHMGLYDDWEDDLGVPWAAPLSRYRRP